MKKDPSIFLFHIQENIEALERFTKGFTFEDFRKDEKTRFAVIRALEVIGEASKNIPKEFQSKHKEINWKGVAGTRDRLIHHYFGVDLKLTFRIIKQEVPILKTLRNKLLLQFCNFCCKFAIIFQRMTSIHFKILSNFR